MRTEPCGRRGAGQCRGADSLRAELRFVKEGDHPLAGGVFVGPTYMTTYAAPLKGSAYRLRETVER